MIKQFMITDALEKDVDEIIAMHAKSWLDTYPNIDAGVSREWVATRVAAWSNAEKRAQRLEKIQQAANDNNILYRVAKNPGGGIIGLSLAYRDAIGQYVGAVYVEKSYHGAGLGKELMDEVIAWADPTRPLELEVATYNERAKAFYRKYGFMEVPGSERDYDAIPVVKMIREKA